MCQTRHGEVRVWQLPEKAKILMDRRQEDGEDGENMDEPAQNQGNESESNELLKEENDFKDMNISIVGDYCTDVVLQIVVNKFC